MKVKLKIYAKALAEVILSKPASAEASAWQRKIADNFLALLAKSGQQKKAKEILDLAEDLLLAKQGKRKIIFETARKMTADQKKLLHSVAKDGDKIQEKINPELIAGVKIIMDNQRQLDASMKRKLENIF